MFGSSYQLSAVSVQLKAVSFQPSAFSQNIVQYGRDQKLLADRLTADGF
jgi:hypothetical protein